MNGVTMIDEMSMQPDANDGKIYVWRFPIEGNKEDYYDAIIIPEFEKAKIWGAMIYEKLGELVIFPEKHGDGKLDVKECTEFIKDGEMMMWRIEDGMFYHKGIPAERRKELENMDGLVEDRELGRAILQS